MRVLIVYTGVGNLYSLKSAIEKLGGKAVIGLNAKLLDYVDAIILPGVGSYDGALKRIKDVKEELIERIRLGVPTLGICLGYQLLFEKSEEGRGKGLGIFKGEVVRLPNTVKIPHIGWNTLENIKHSPLTEGVREGSYVYFVHSYYPKPKEPIVLAETLYGIIFPSVSGKGNVFGVQFHPERSGSVGLRFLLNFLRVVKR